MEPVPTVVKEKSIEEKMVEWLAYRKLIDDLTEKASVLKKEVEAECKLVEIEGAQVIQTQSGTYDWEKIGKFLKPSKETIKAYTIVDWKALAEAYKVKDGLLQKAKAIHHQVGTPFYQLRLKK